MKKLVLLIGLTFSFMSALAQQADARIGELVGKSDYFTLEKEYPVLKDSLQSKVLGILAEILINMNFNRPVEAIDNITDILKNHQQEIGFDNCCAMVSIGSSLNGQCGNYAQAADDLKGFIDQLKAAGAKMDLTSYEKLYKKYNELRQFPAPNVSCPNKDIEIPVSIEPIKLLKPINGEKSRGLEIIIPVTVHKKQHRFIFDTGAAYTYMSEKFAKEIGVKIIRDSILLNEGMMGAGYGMEGFLDSLQIGEIVFRNVIVAIGKPNATVDSVVQIDAVLGMDFMKLMKEIRIHTKEQKIVFPAQTTPLPSTGRNLLLTENNKPILKADSNGQRLLFFLDTGNNKADLFYTYYNKYKNEIDKTALKDTVTGGGFGFMRTKDVLRMPSVSFNVGDTPVKMKDIRVHFIAENDQSNDDGNLGMDLIKLFDKTIINLQDMFIKFE